MILMLTIKRFLITLFLNYLRFLAKLQLKKNPHAKIIGVTGSSGKSTTHWAIYATLKNSFKIKLSKKANSESGIPLDILGLHPFNYHLLEWLKLAVLAPIQLIINWEKFDIYLVEMGIDGPDEPKNMHYLLKILRPHIAVFTNVTTSHAQSWDKLVPFGQPGRINKLKQLIAQEKGLLLTQLQPNDWAVYNLDDPFIAKIAQQSRGHKLSVAKNKQADLRMINIASDHLGLKILLQFQSQTTRLVIRQPFMSQDLAVDFTLAIAVGLTFKLPLIKLTRSLSRHWRCLPGRGNILAGIHQSSLIDASYNAQPNAVISSLNLFKQLRIQGRKIAILGDMRELGQSSKYWYEKIAQQASKIIHLDSVVLVGPQMKQFFIPAMIQAGFSHHKIYHFNNTYRAAIFAKNLIKPNDLILVQASQNNLLFEIIVAELMQDKQQVDQLLCRRSSPYWQQQRQRIMQAGGLK